MILRRLFIAFTLAFFCLGGLAACTSKKTTAHHAGLTRITGNDRVTQALLKAHYTDWKGTRYARGGMSRSGIDCSAFTRLTYRELFGMDLPRTTAEQAQGGVTVSRKELRPGDLVFFKTGFWQKHVGIYLADAQFMHVSSSKGVMLSSLNSDYWDDQFWQAKRY